MALPELADLEARLLYRDGLMLVIDKPAGIPVHAGPGGGPNLDEQLERLRFGLPRAPGLAHRLDRDTSGCLVLGRHRKALARLGRLFAAGRIEKVYWAVVRGAPEGTEGRIEAPLSKLTPERGWKMVADPEKGQPAVTEWRLLGRSDGFCWLECRPLTGRTHQVRVHLQLLGCPVVGDSVYGGDGARPLHLHARAITIPLYPNRAPITVTAPVPLHMRELLEACGWRGE